MADAFESFSFVILDTARRMVTKKQETGTWKDFLSFLLGSLSINSNQDDRRDPTLQKAAEGKALSPTYSMPKLKPAALAHSPALF